MKNQSTKFIPKSRSDSLARLKKLEEEKQQLILERKEEIFSIIDRIGCLSIDNELLAGSLELLKEIDSYVGQGKDLPGHLKEFEKLIRERAPIFFRRKQRSNKS